MATPVATPTPLNVAIPPANVGGAPAAPALTPAQQQAVQSNLVFVPTGPNAPASATTDRKVAPALDIAASLASIQAQLQAVAAAAALPSPGNVPVPTAAPLSADQQQIAALTQQLAGLQALLGNSRRTLTLEDRSIYVGEVNSSGQPHGRGVATYPADDQYQRQRYDGEWLNSARTGWGTMTWTSGYAFVGSWVNGSREGRGTHMYTNGDRCEAVFRNDKANGEGKYTWPDGNVYTGNFVDDKRQGQGRLIFSNGTRYTGAFVNNQRHGHGTEIEGNRWVYEGEWVNDIRHGKFKVSAGESSASYSFVNGVPKSNCVIL